jgi:hypothetical protein
MDILEQLKNDADYYGAVGKQFLSNSDIGVLLTNPQAFGVDREDNKNFAEGRYFHQLLIEPDKAKNVLFVDASTRNTNIYKDFIKENGIEICLLKKEKEDIENLAGIIKGNIQFYDEIFKSDSKYEVPAVKMIHGRMWKGKTDIENPTFLIDLKTTSDINKFKYSAKTYNYDSQAYIYQELFGKPLVFYVIDKETGQLGIFHPSENFIRGGEAKVVKAIEVYDKYFGPNAIDDIQNYFINEVLD